jgi:peptidoglycan/LPS O-acetylase OafA/YrhL
MAESPILESDWWHWLRRSGLLVVALLVVYSYVADGSAAGIALLYIILFGAVGLGLIQLVRERSAVTIAAAATLGLGGIYGIVLLYNGSEPFSNIVVLISLAAGTGLTIFNDDR